MTETLNDPASDPLNDPAFQELVIRNLATQVANQAITLAQHNALAQMKQQAAQPKAPQASPAE